MPATVILNPYANRWGAKEKLAEIEANLKRIGVDYEVFITEAGRHATQLAKEAYNKGNHPIIACGGDGTISEVVNGIMQAAGDNLPAGPVAFFPIGTGNDLCDMLDLPRAIDAVADIIAAGNTTTMDVGKVNEYFFSNNSAVGLETTVTIENIKLTKLKGVFRYIVSSLIAIAKNPTWHGTIEWAEGRYEGSLKLVSIGNSRRTGGTFHMTPDASLTDGLLDFMFGPEFSRLGLLNLLPKAIEGEHIHHPLIQMYRTAALTIKLKTPSAIQTDGEIVEEAVTEIKYSVIPGALKVFTPAD